MTLLVTAVVIGLIAYLSISAGRQFKADRDFRPIRVPAAALPGQVVAGQLAALAHPPSTSPPGAVGASSPTPAGVELALRQGLASPGLGPVMAAEVSDVGSGQTLFSLRASSGAAPASTAKLLVAAAMLRAFKATDQFSTTVVAGAAAGTIVLIGGGDPTLTAAAANTAPAYPGAARISDLAAQIKKSGRPVTGIEVDDSLFSGPLTAPGWAPEDAPSEYASPITAAMVDGGRDEPSALLRSANPDLAAGFALAGALGVSVPVTRAAAPAAATVLATVRSAQVGRLVEQMLQQSDDVIAEVLGRQVAIAARQPASFDGAAAAVNSTLAAIGVAVGTGMRDASGLSVLDQVTPATLSGVLMAGVSPQHAELHSIVSSLPVAGWDGTLADRFGATSAVGKGVVRAKTGTLGNQGVNTEAGYVSDAAGRELTFVFMTSGAPDVDSSRAALDALAARLAGCGCG